MCEFWLYCVRMAMRQLARKDVKLLLQLAKKSWGPNTVNICKESTEGVPSALRLLSTADIPSRDIGEAQTLLDAS